VTKLMHVSEHRPNSSSADFEWRAIRDLDGDLVEEVWEAGEYEFYIARAKRIIKKHPRPVVKVAVQQFLGPLELMVILAPEEERLPCDISFPVILGTMPRGGLVLIDGWHRLDHAVQVGLQEISAVVLTIKETNKVRRRVG
jgi:hypothetical protein